MGATTTCTGTAAMCSPTRTVNCCAVAGVVGQIPENRMFGCWKSAFRGDGFATLSSRFGATSTRRSRWPTFTRDITRHWSSWSIGTTTSGGVIAIESTSDSVTVTGTVRRAPPCVMTSSVSPTVRAISRFSVVTSTSVESSLATPIGARLGDTMPRSAIWPTTMSSFSGTTVRPSTPRPSITSISVPAVSLSPNVAASLPVPTISPRNRRRSTEAKYEGVISVFS